MELVLKSKIYDDISIDKNKLIGLIGTNSDNFINSLSKKNVAYVPKKYDFYTNLVDSELSFYFKNDYEKLVILLKEFGLDENFLNKKISDLSSGEQHILNYLLVLLQNKKIIIVDEPFLDLDYMMKKKLISLFKRIIYESDKTIIITSKNSNIIYELCDNVLLLEKEYYYGSVKDIFTNMHLMEKYQVDIPNIVEFVNIVKRKKKKIDYSFDIRDLIKDVYKCV